MKFNVPGLRNFELVENFHIFFWLIKDISWCLELKILGISMIIPTIFVTIMMIYKARKRPDFWVNISVFFWISANSYWMCAEFFGHAELKDYAVIPFCFGFIAFFVYLYKLNRVDTNIE
jgi:hypothetical protein